jgi:serine/threonine-protein kinase HSL1 (negative regulator of Swe1 kinase)
MFYNALARFRDEQLENYQGQPLEYSASDYHHISRPGGRVRRGRSQTGQGNSKRRAQYPSVKEFPRRLSSFKEPMSSGTVESYDPYRSPKNGTTVTEAEYAQITIHREPPENSVDVLSSPKVEPPPSIAEEEEPEDVNEDEGSPFTILQKRKHKPSSMKSFHSSKIPHSSSRAPGLSTHSTSYRRNVSFHHVRNRSHGSTTAKPKRRKTAAPTQQGPTQQAEIRQSPSTCSLQLLANTINIPDIPSSPPLPAQPTVVRANAPKVKSLRHARKVRDSDYTWKEDTRKVSHELSQICEEAFNGSSVSTIRTASAGSGYETPGTPVSMPSPEQLQPATHLPVSKTTTESPRSYNITHLTETRRKLAEHSRGRKDNIPRYLSGVINHLDRLIEEDKTVNGPRLDSNMATYQDPFVTSPAEGLLPVINEEFASPAHSPSETSIPQPQPRASLAVSQGADPRVTIRMVPHSSFRSMEEVKPLTIRKKHYGKSEPSGSDFTTSDSVATDRSFSTGSRQAPPGGLAPIAEVPLSPKKYSSVGSQGKKWSWFKHRSSGSDTSPALPPKDPHPIIPSGGTIVHKPITLEAPPPPPALTTERVPVRKTSMDRFGGAFFKKLMTKKSNKREQEHVDGNFLTLTSQHPSDRFIEQENELQTTPTMENRNSIMCTGIADTDSSCEGDDPRIQFRNKRRSLANQNWFARVFQIRPATQVIALNTSKAKGRKELYKLLREWRDFGMEDVYLDKTNSIVHGRVCEANCKLTHTFPTEFY